MAFKHPFSTCLWFNGDAEEAVQYYAEIFPGTTINNISRYGEGAPFPAGTALTVSFQMNGQSFLALNGGPQFTFNESISFVVHCDAQGEIDHYWYALTKEGKESMCGWLTDKYGVSWQIVPTQIEKWMQNGEPTRVGRMMQALLSMRRLVIAELESAYNS